MFARMAIHATPLVQFYTPFVATVQRIFAKGNQVDTTLILPKYVHVFQIVLRLLLLVPLSLVLSLAFGNSQCFFSRSKLNNSYECLNEFEGVSKTHQMWVILGGLIAAAVVAPICYHVSDAIFTNYTAYLAKFELPRDMQPMQEIRMSIVIDSSSRQKSSSLKKQKREEQKRASVSSFQALLGAD